MSSGPIPSAVIGLDSKTPVAQAHRASDASLNTWDDDDRQDTLHSGDIPIASLYHIYSTAGMFSRRTLSITLEDKKTVAWHVTFPKTGTLFSSKPDVQIQRSSADGLVVGTGSFHTFSPDEIVFPGGAGASTTLDRDGVFTQRHRITLGGKQYFWKGTRRGTSMMSSGNLKLADGDGKVHATFMSVEHKSVSKIGRLSIVVPGLEEKLVEQIVVSCMVLHEKQRREGGSSAAGGAAGGAGGGGGG